MWPVLCGEPLHYPTEFRPPCGEPGLLVQYLTVWASLIYCLARQIFAVHHRAHYFHTVHNTSQIAERTLFHNKGSSRVLCRFFPLPSSSGSLLRPANFCQQTLAPPPINRFTINFLADHRCYLRSRTLPSTRPSTLPSTLPSTD